VKILQLNNIAGVPVYLNKALRQLGVDSQIVVFRDNTHWGFDHNLNVDRFPRPAQPFYRFASLLKSHLDYDIYHYHSSSFLTGYADAPLLKALGKKLVYHHHGSDIRGKGIPLLSRFADARYVSTPDLLDWAPEAEWLPNPIYRDDYAKYITKGGNRGVSNKALKVAHSSKGKREHRKSDAIEKTCLKLQAEGIVEWVSLEGLPRKEFLKKISEVDVYIDNLGGGWYGMAALEAMSMKKAVCVYVREDLEGYGDESAYANVNEGNIEETLRDLAQDEELRQNYAKAGFGYVNKKHDAKKIAKRVLKKYREIL